MQSVSDTGTTRWCPEKTSRKAAFGGERCFSD